MKLMLSAALCAAMTIGAGAAYAQGARPAAEAAHGNEDNVVQAGRFPLAAPAGLDSGAFNKAPAGAVNQGKYDIKKYKFGPAGDPPAGGSPIWNPVMAKMKAGGKVTGGTVFNATDGATYCAMANAGYDFIWTEMQHSARDWQSAANMWATCPHAKAVPGVRIAFANEREEQHALDAGAIVLVVPTIRTEAEAKEAAKWAFFPPMGHRSSGGGQGSSNEFWGGVPGGYRNTINDNLVLVLMIETLEGLQEADAIAKVKGVTAVFAASGDLANHTGYRQNEPDYERNINIVHDAAIKAGVRLCGPYAWRDRPDFSCFQNSSEAGVIGRGVAAELGPDLNTQGRPTVGPYAARPAAAR